VGPKFYSQAGFVNGLPVQIKLCYESPAQFFKVSVFRLSDLLIVPFRVFEKRN
jgi:hypothetical protein